VCRRPPAPDAASTTTCAAVSQNFDGDERLRGGGRRRVDVARRVTTGMSVHLNTSQHTPSLLVANNDLVNQTQTL